MLKGRLQFLSGLVLALTGVSLWPDPYYEETVYHTTVCFHQLFVAKDQVSPDYYSSGERYLERVTSIWFSDSFGPSLAIHELSAPDVSRQMPEMRSIDHIASCPAHRTIEVMI